jgi:ABC-type protease/lipase transport system fused ATPase/permease subunit
MVLQDVFLFSGTIEDNLALGRPELDRERIRRAASAVEADRFVTRLPDGYATDLRERGANLSAGQRQLLSFARALRSADVVLDEATSSIDARDRGADPARHPRADGGQDLARHRPPALHDPGRGSDLRDASRAHRGVGQPR